MTSDFETLLVTLDDGVLDVVLNRPEKRNAFNLRMEAEFETALDEAEADPNVTAVVLTGAGDVFSAGHDLEERAANRRGRRVRPSRAGTLPRAWYFQKPLISGVHEFVGPHGMSILACCDFNIAAEGTRFSFEHLRVGALSPPGHLAPLYFQFPFRVMEKLMLMAGWMDAEQARELHFVQRVVPPGEVHAEARRWARQASQLSTSSFIAAKQGIRRVYETLGLGWMQGLRAEGWDGNESARAFEALVAEQGIAEALRVRNSNFDDAIAQL